MRISCSRGIPVCMLRRRDNSGAWSARRRWAGPSDARSGKYAAPLPVPRIIRGSIRPMRAPPHDLEARAGRPRPSSCGHRREPHGCDGLSRHGQLSLKPPRHSGSDRECERPSVIRRNCRSPPAKISVPVCSSFTRIGTILARNRRLGASPDTARTRVTNVGRLT